MKKTYINPDLAVVKLQTTQLIAASLNSMDENGGEVTIGGEELGGEVEGEARGGFFDDEY